MKNTPLFFFSTDGSSLHPVYVDIVDRRLAHARAREDASKRRMARPRRHCVAARQRPSREPGKGAKPPSPPTLARAREVPINAGRGSVLV